jgi:recombinational DNA repair protein (RecF pathway)
MEETTVQREDVLGEAIQILEIEGIANPVTRCAGCSSPCGLKNRIVGKPSTCKCFSRAA